jgi:hypothetical protein
VGIIESGKKHNYFIWHSQQQQQQQQQHFYRPDILLSFLLFLLGNFQALGCLLVCLINIMGWKGGPIG